MSNIISATSKNVFNFFQDISIHPENTTGKNLSSALKIASCFVLIASLYVGVKYVISLIGRASQSDASSSKDVEDISEKSTDEQLEEFFKSSEQTAKNFIIGGQDVWVIFNPKQEEINHHGLSLDRHVLIFLTLSSDSLVSRIVNKAPLNFNSCYVESLHLNPTSFPEW
jgi:hypothetical protein